jgi:NitT/TauT family transport system permease protein
MSEMMNTAALSRWPYRLPRLVMARGLPSWHAVVSAGIPLAVLVLWQIGSSFDFVDAAILPSPFECAQAWQRWMFGAAGRSLDTYSGTWFFNLGYSLARVAQGFGLAGLIGVPLGIMIGWMRSVSVLDASVQLLRPVPITAWLPFSIAFFGIHNSGAVFLIALGAFYPIVVSATQGARQTNPILVRAARMLGAPDLMILWRVVVPSALPTIFVGLRLGVGVAWTAVVIAEMVSVKTGLGYVLWDAYYLGRMDIVIADMVSIGLLGFLSDLIVVLVGRRLIQWQH